MLSYYLTWHLQDRLVPLLFTDDDKPAAHAARTSPVAPAARSPRALAKAAAKRTGSGLPVDSFSSLLADLATICLNQIQPADPALPGFQLVAAPTPVQRQALDLLGVSHRLGGRVVRSPLSATQKPQVTATHADHRGKLRLSRPR